MSNHYDLVKKVLEKLAHYGLQIKLSKCKFAYNEIEYLGYTVSEFGIRPSESHIKAVTNYPTPRNQKELQSFIGLCSYFRKFVKSFSIIARPLYDLLKKNQSFASTMIALTPFKR